MRGLDWSGWSRIHRHGRRIHQHKRRFLHFSLSRAVWSAHARCPPPPRPAHRRRHRLGGCRRHHPRLHPVRREPAPRHPPARDRAAADRAQGPRHRADGRWADPRRRGRPGAGVAQRVEGVVGDLRAGRVGRLSISYFASAGAAWIPPVVAGLMHEFPDLRLDLRLIELLGDEHPDPDIEIFVGGAAEHLRESPGTASRRCTTCSTTPMSWWFPADHPLAGEPPGGAGPSSARERWVDNDFNRGFCRQVILDACTEAGFTPDFRIETHDYPTAISFVAAGVGVTVLPSPGRRPAARGRRRDPARGAHTGAARLRRGEGLGGAPPGRPPGRRTAA